MTLREAAQAVVDEWAGSNANWAIFCRLMEALRAELASPHEPATQGEPLTDEELKSRNYTHSVGVGMLGEAWHDGFKHGFREAEAAHGIGGKHE